MAPVLRRDNSALNHGYTAEQQAHAIEALWALSGILILSKFQEKKMRKQASWKRKQAKKVDKGKQLEVPAPAHLAGTEMAYPEISHADRITADLTPEYLAKSATLVGAT
ncbi:uncharacterized protein N7529_010486 [Penicillium soppii]|uniref:uncharacterized protein n=1 Tax=Penicillium soppii TaxID=69789 RepID=UPI0025474D0A|nr:uncharacterized protein N7529_010486 [Penicillium soppii]KAJ5856542.1 hypothetical protein N7529_010486 [Penicillium soppii]